MGIGFSQRPKLTENYQLPEDPPPPEEPPPNPPKLLPPEEPPELQPPKKPPPVDFQPVFFPRALSRS